MTRDILIHRVIARLNVGGPAMHVVLLTREFEGRKDFRARLIAGSVMESEGDMSYFAEERGVDVTHLEQMSRTLSPFDDLRSFVELWRLFRREKPDIVHTHTAKAGALGRLAAALAGVPVRIHTYHGHVLGGDYFSPQKTAFFRGVEKALSILTQRLVVLTPSQHEEMCARMAVADAEKFTVVPLGLELDPFAVAGGLAPPRREEDGGGSDTETQADQGSRRGTQMEEARSSARSRLDLDPDDIVVGIVGRLVPIKNHELLFDAVPRLREQLKKRSEERLNDGVNGGREDDPAEHPGGDAEEDGGEAGPPAEATRLQILVVGSGEREDALKEYAREKGIDDQVVWLGWRKDLPHIYPALDVLALPSKDEGTPVAVIEALAAGVPVVARDVGGVAEVLEGGEWGTLVQQEDSLADAFADALAGTLLDPPPPEARAAASRRVRERFGLDRLVQDLEAIYLEELARAH